MHRWKDCSSAHKASASVHPGIYLAVMSSMSDMYNKNQELRFEVEHEHLMLDILAWSL